MLPRPEAMGSYHFTSFLWPPLETELSISSRITLNKPIHTILTSNAILNPNDEDCTEINYRIVNTLIQDDTKTSCSLNPVDYENKLGETFSPC